MHLAVRCGKLRQEILPPLCSATECYVCSRSVRAWERGERVECSVLSAFRVTIGDDRYAKQPLRSVTQVE